MKQILVSLRLPVDKPENWSDASLAALAAEIRRCIEKKALIDIDSAKAAIVEAEQSNDPAVKSGC